MKKLLMLSIPLILCLYMGCAPRVQLPPDDIPEWDSPVSPDWMSDIDPPLDPNKLSEYLFEGESGYNFRKTRWGFSRERVELSEEGIRPDERTRELLVYRIKINGVKCKLIYTFKDNKLRTAGYITILPIRNAEKLIQKVIEKYGDPTMPELEHGMVWKGDDSIIWTNSYASVIKETITKYNYTDGGMLGDLLYRELEKQKQAGEVVYFDGVIGYVDSAFYDKLQRMRFRPAKILLELSRNEKLLMGILQRDGQTIIPGLGRIPH
ncbi:hypothetical protein C6499_22575 [Candidatus Poribacteria bacterium]|nr:MAG: hypothetical protein C6499_22575 [Candidatus Poribacteria bacterium]